MTRGYIKQLPKTDFFTLDDITTVLKTAKRKDGLLTINSEHFTAGVNDFRTDILNCCSNDAKAYYKRYLKTNKIKEVILS